LEPGFALVAIPGNYRLLKALRAPRLPGAVCGFKNSLVQRQRPGIRLTLSCEKGDSRRAFSSKRIRGCAPTLRAQIKYPAQEHQTGFNAPEANPNQCRSESKRKWALNNAIHVTA
jgi:hypothetical protein